MSDNLPAFDLKGSTRSRYARVGGSTEYAYQQQNGDINQTPTLAVHPVLDENFMEFAADVHCHCAISKATSMRRA